MRTFDNINLDQLEIEAKPATIKALIDALYDLDIGQHEEENIVCTCWVCQNLVPALMQIEKELTALREVATAAEWFNDVEYGLCCPICDNSPTRGHAANCPYTKARAAGYLPTDEVTL